MTPLHFGAKHGYNDVVSYLLTVQGIDVNSRTNSGWTPLHMSAMKGHNGISSLLSSFEGVEVSARDNAGNTPLHYAASEGFVDITQLLLSKGTDINCINNKGETPMHMAVKKDRLNVVEFLLAQNDYNMTIQDSEGKMAYEIASPEILNEFKKKYPEIAQKEKENSKKCRI